jgi:hypothetical protein
MRYGKAIATHNILSYMLMNEVSSHELLQSLRPVIAANVCA